MSTSTTEPRVHGLRSHGPCVWMLRAGRANRQVVSAHRARRQVPHERGGWRGGRRPPKRGDGAGFSLIELLLWLALTLCLAAAIAPVWASFELASVRAGDRTVWTLQGKVACARLEKDLRAAGVRACPFSTGSPLLQATPTQVVLLVSGPDPAGSSLVEWELAGGSLMRRWGPCPASLPASFAHSLYSDSKTMLENVDTGRSGFSCRAAGRAVASPVGTTDLLLIDGLCVRIVERTSNVRAPLELLTSSGVGR